LRYTPAIDGLRAIAVVLVLLYHAKAPFFPGGYIGVDVFFVISGYLITMLILQQQADGRFTLMKFYEGRLRRILPAYFLVVFSTLSVSLLFALPADARRLGSSAVAATLFISNVYFSNRGAGYLRDAPEMDPFLHTWSLGIEGQFYLLFPILTVLVTRLTKRLDLIFMGMMLASLAVSVYVTSSHPQAAYYFFPSRAWELFLGCWLAVARIKDLAPRQIVSVLQFAGLAAVIGAACIYTERTQFPGLAAVVPCVGTALIIAWSDKQSQLNSWLSFPAIVWLGLISYPLYLWHWPSLALARGALLREPDVFEIAVLYGLSVFLAAITWRYVEQPVRKRKILIPVRHLFASAAATTCLAAGVGLGVRASAGVWGPPPPNVAYILAAAKDYAPLHSACHNWDRRAPELFLNCTIGDKDKESIDFVLWGDSHAGALGMAVDTAAINVSKKGLQLTADNCPPLLRTHVILRNKETDCNARNDIALDLLHQHRIRRVILASAWSQYLGRGDKELKPVREPAAAKDNRAVFRWALEQTISKLRAMHIDVLIVGPVPKIGWDVPSMLAAAEWRKRPSPEGPSFENFLLTERDIISALRELEHSDVHVFYPHELLCNSICRVKQHGEVLYSDTEHLSIKGAELLIPAFVSNLSRPSGPEANCGSLSNTFTRARSGQAC
jgi:peptidoglycan/LPS O-acetylase OafA/YrhL